MRECYGARLSALNRELGRYLGGVVRLPKVQAGLSTPAFLPRGLSARLVVAHGARHDLDLWSLDRYALQRSDLRGLCLGFAAFRERQLHDGVVALARAIEDARPHTG